MEEEVTPQIRQLIDLLCPCIHDKNIVQFYYSDENTGKKHKEGYRVCEPYLIGVNEKGNYILVAFANPREEDAREGAQPDWKQFLLRRITNLEIGAGKYIHTRPFYNPNDDRMVKIICRTQVC